MLKKLSNPGSHRRLVQNVIWNLAGAGLPLLAAVFAIPLLIDGMGTARFGILTIVWMVVGYFSLFDMGLGRSLTKLLSDRLGAGNVSEIPRLVWSAMFLMAGLGIVGAIVIAGLSPYLVGVAFKIPDELREEMLTALYLLAAALPVVISSNGLRGILEAHQRFGLVNIVRIPLGLITFLGPLMALMISNTLPVMVFVLVCARVISWVTYLLICLTLYPELRQRAELDGQLIKALLAFGGWMTVSNITGPLLLYLGRLLIVVLISAEAVAYFSTSYEIVTKLLLIPTMLAAVLFPTFTLMFQKEPEQVAALYRKTMLYLFIIMLPLSLIVWFFAKEGLAWWINEEFSNNGFEVARLLAVGVFINSFGHISQALIQSYGRPDITAKLHVLELLFYVPYLWGLVVFYGIEGAAIGWTIRVAISTLALTYLAKKCIDCSSVNKH